MKFNKAEVQALAKSIRNPMVLANEKLIELNKNAADAFVKKHPRLKEQMDLNSRLLTNLRREDYNVEYVVRQHVLKDFKYPHSPKQIPDLQSIEDAIVIAGINSEDVKEIVANVAKQFA